MRRCAKWLISLFLIALAPQALHAAVGDRQLLVKATPVYPVIAKKMRVYGTIRLMVSVLPNGQVGTMVLESGHPLLVEAAKQAVKQWRFAAASETTTTSVVVRFVLPE